MPEQKTVTVAETTGTTVVVNNKRDGVKKYSLLFLGLFIAALAQTLKAAFPKWGAVVDIALDSLTALGLIGGGTALTSPFDKRGVVLDHNGMVTVDPSRVPSAPSAPTGPGGGVGVSAFLCAVGLFAMFGLTGCSLTAEGPPAAAIPQSCPAVYRQPVPLVATASKTMPARAVTTSGLKNPGAQPGENFSVASGGSCQTVQTVDGWVTICPQPNDGDSFDARNQRAYVPTAPPVQVAAAAPPPAPVVVPARPAPVVVPAEPDTGAARLELKARFPGLLGT